MSKIYKVWLERIESGTFTHAQCRQWANVVLPLSMDCQPGGHRTNLEPDEARMLIQKLTDRKGVRLTPEHSEKGLKWLERYAAEKMPNLPSDWRERFSHFLYMGHGEEYGTSYRTMVVPIWRIVLKDGAIWDYYSLAWQSDQDWRAWRVSSIVPAGGIIRFLDV